LSVARRLQLPGLLLGAVLRALALPLPGAEDVSAFKIWMYNARALARFATAGTVTAAVILVPIVIRGAWWNMLTGVRRLAMYDMVSAQAANVWWLVTYVLRVSDVWRKWGPALALTQRLRILGITRVVALGYPNPRIVGFGLVGAAIVAAGWRISRAPSLAVAAALVGWTTWAYAVFAAQAHENHLLLAVSLFSLAAGLDRRFRPMCWTVSIVAAINLYLFGGFGLSYPPIDRLTTVIDASVLLAVVNVGTFFWFTLNRKNGLLLVRHLA
jgi:hypothetical protein